MYDAVRLCLGFAPLLMRCPIPSKADCCTVIGTPIDVSNPSGEVTDEKIDELLAKFEQEICALYERHRGKFSPDYPEKLTVM